MAWILNYNNNTFIVQATVATIIKHLHNTFIVQATVAMIKKHYHNMFIVQATVATNLYYDNNVERYGSCHSGEIRMGSMSRHQASLK